MLTKLNREECLRQYKKFPIADNSVEQVFFPDVCKSYFLSIAKAPKPQYIRKLSVAVAGLIHELGFDHLILIGDGDRPWLYRHQENTGKSKSITEAIEYFVASGVGKRFNGALLADTLELPKFFRHMYWLTSPNSALPIFHFMDKDENILGSICQYGVVHFYTLNNAADDLFSSVVSGKPTFIFSAECQMPYGK